MRPKEQMVLEHALEIGVQIGVRRAYKHTEKEPPDQWQQEVIAQEIANILYEWFYLEDPQQ